MKPKRNSWRIAAELLPAGGEKRLCYQRPSSSHRQLGGKELLSFDLT